MKKKILILLIGTAIYINQIKPVTKKAIHQNTRNEDLLDQNTIGTGAGILNKNFDTASDVITLGGLASPHSKLKTDSGVEIVFTGKERFDASTGVNNKYLNSENYNLDSYLIPGKSTTDIGIMASAGKNAGYNNDVISLGIDLRSRTTWGKPQEAGKTTISNITSNGISYGAHNHTIGIPIVYIRGVDLTLDINSLLCDIPSFFPTQKLKLGFFPLEIGRGISLGAAYLVSPDVLSYAPVDVIQEYAPGIMLYGPLNIENSLDYRLYLGIIKNLSGSVKDIAEKTKLQQYNGNLFPYRGFGVFNMIAACQVDWKCINDEEKKVIISPYMIVAHEGAGKVLIPEDSINNLFTYGFEFSAEKTNDWDIDFEFAKNIGSQYVYGIDTNELNLEQRTCTIENNPNTSVSLITNSQVTFLGYDTGGVSVSATTDIIDKNTVYLGTTSKRQQAIDNVYKNSTSNGTIINLPEEGYSLKNSSTRFRDPYQNLFTGSMAVFDIGKTINICNTDIKFAAALGYASGGDNPNKSLVSKNDHIGDSVYNGFIGVQEIYSGKMVRSAFLMSGAGQMPRVNSIPATILDNNGNIIEAVEYPSPISGFNNLLYCGGSVNFIHEGNKYKWKWYPNVLWYGQPDARTIYSQDAITKLGKNELNPYLGSEINLFLEIMSKEFEGFKIFFVSSIFLPGDYYKDLSQIPLNSDTINYLKAKASSINSSYNIPLINNHIAYYVNLGLEFKF